MSEGIIEFCFGPNLGLKLEAGTKLNNYASVCLRCMYLLGLGDCQLSLAGAWAEFDKALLTSLIILIV